MPNKTGTKNNVAQVAVSKPPITARPRGAFCSPPSPKPKAMGAIPMIMASAVMMTGRKRVKPASRPARTGSPVCNNLSRAKLMTRMLLAVATPMHMMAPVSAGTDSVVLVANSIQTMPANAAGSAITTMNGSLQDWKLTTINR